MARNIGRQAHFHHDTSTWGYWSHVHTRSSHMRFIINDIGWGNMSACSVVTASTGSGAPLTSHKLTIKGPWTPFPPYWNGWGTIHLPLIPVPFRQPGGHFPNVITAAENAKLATGAPHSLASAARREGKKRPIFFFSTLIPTLMHPCLVWT